jgi:hypothetical protein
MHSSINTRKQALIMAISITMVVGLVYWPALKLPFIQDDFSVLAYIQQNTAYSTLKSFFDVNHWLFFRPLAKTYLLVMYEIFGDNAMWFHIAALVAHAINSFLVGLIIFSVTRDKVISYCAALIYAAAITIHLDSLAWAVGIYDLGATFFFLLSMRLFFDRKIAWSGAAYFAGCLFKEAVIVLPIILLFHELLLKDIQTNWKTWIVEQWKGAALFVLLVCLIGAIKFYQLSSLNLPSNNPYSYVFSLSTVVYNITYYLHWMLQSFFPFAYRVRYLSIIVILLSIIFVWSARNRGDVSRQILFLLGWIIIGLLPVIFLPNHTYRYYATYSLPAYICLVLYLAKSIMNHLTTKTTMLNFFVIAICLVAITFSIQESNQIYRGELSDENINDGTNNLIGSARLVNSAHHSLKKYISTIPSHSIILIGGLTAAECGSFHNDSGPQFWYKEKYIHVLCVGNLKFGRGQVIIDSAAAAQIWASMGSTSKQLYIDPSRFFGFLFANGELVRFDPRNARLE